MDAVYPNDRWLKKMSTLENVKKQVYEAIRSYENDWPNSHLSE